MKPGTVLHSYNPGNQEADAGGLQVQPMNCLRTLEYNHLVWE
jgi:hypothetical protein